MSKAPSRWILRHRRGPAPAEDLATIREAAGVRVLDAEGVNVLFEARAADARRLAARLDGWLLAPERTIPPPRPR